MGCVYVNHVNAGPGLQLIQILARQLAVIGIGRDIKHHVTVVRTYAWPFAISCSVISMISAM
ncbi:hypothetical protein ACNKHO_03020 [Shigella flexneri]